MTWNQEGMTTPHAVGYNAKSIPALRAPPVRRTRAVVPSDADRKRAMDRLTLLKSLSFGSQVAEDEIQDLQSYFVETDQWSRIFGGKIDIVRGEKGTGKSAIYLLLSKNGSALFDKQILIVNAENPKGSTVFKDPIPDPPASEAEFILLWKLYILVLIVSQIREYDLKGTGLNSILVAMQVAGLIEPELNLSGILRTAQVVARRLLTQARVETGVELNEVTGAPSGIIGRISLSEPTGELRSKGINSLDGYLRAANAILAQNGFSIWVLLDRLDVAFAENHHLEANALRALLRVYGDIRALDNISMKIFIREDIWKRVT